MDIIKMIAVDTIIRTIVKGQSIIDVAKRIVSKTEEVATFLEETNESIKGDKHDISM